MSLDASPAEISISGGVMLAIRGARAFDNWSAQTSADQSSAGID